MASLFRQGLIHDFVCRIPEGADIEPDYPGNAKTLMVLDFSNADAESRYRAKYREWLGTPRGAVPRKHIEDNLAVLERLWWVEFVGIGTNGRPFRVAQLGRVHRTDSKITLAASLWTDLSDGRVASAVYGKFTLDFSEDGDLSVAPAITDVFSTFNGHQGISDHETEESFFLTSLDGMLAVCALNRGWFVTERVGANAFTFSEQRKAKAAPRYIERKKSLLAMDVREVKAFLDTPPAPEWREFDPLAERAARGPHCGYREHEVRPFTRHYKKSGKIVQVRGFKRGNPALGSLIRMTSVQP
jgi:hypothetical protein